ncbi:hypothetical protein ACTXT7_009442 [Hymenolepis weldensis]
MSPSSLPFDLRTFSWSNISLSHPSPDLNGRGEQLLDNVRGQFLVSQGEETVEKILNSLQFRYRMMPHVGDQIMKTNRTEIYLDTYYLPSPWNLEIPEAQHDHQPDRYSRLFGRQKKIQSMDNNLHPEALDKNE